MDSIRPLFSRIRLKADRFLELKQATMLYISRALDFPFTTDENEFIQLVNLSRSNRKNITPNGGIVPKKEYILEYNLFISIWCKTASDLIQPAPALLRRFRLTPNIRIKFGTELGENVGRSLSTSLPHSDAWVEGPWGLNCHLPIAGDTRNNYLNFYKLKNTSNFRDDFLALNASYAEMQWVTEYYEEDADLIPEVGYLNLSDYALIHATRRNPGADTRISIDTTVFVGDHDVHPDRRSEYLDSIPVIGEDLFIGSNRSVFEEPMQKSTQYSHYTSGSLIHHKLWGGTP